MKAIVLLSGGLDSATALSVAKFNGFDVHAITFRYGQRHAGEIEAAETIAGELPHLVVDIDLSVFGGSALTSDIDVPKDGVSDGVPVTYVPARNAIFLSLALAWVETLGAADIFIGVNAVDYSGYPDCRPEFVDAYQRMARLATTRRDITIHAPLIELSKAQIIRLGLSLGVDYSQTVTCYDYQSSGACGKCDACRLRLDGFARAGSRDPVVYR
jgi:7-cyano-7-deazaguanine synthase